MHDTITVDRLTKLVMSRETYADSNPGVCKICGHVQDGCEPDAENYNCEICGEDAVTAPELLLMEMV